MNLPFFSHSKKKPAENVDALLIGAGIMSATLGTLIKQLEPDWTIQIFERLGEVAMESSNPWNNAGTGHAALCELNYTPEKDGKIEIGSATRINEQFQLSRQFWAHLVTAGAVPEPKEFINPTPHMTFVQGEKDVAYLKKRYEVLKKEPLFAGIEYSEDSRVIHQWAPLLMKRRRKGVPFAATRAERDAAGDPRPSVEERTPTDAAYVAAVRAAADRLLAERLMLPDDAAASVRAAEAGTLARLGR